MCTSSQSVITANEMLPSAWFAKCDSGSGEQDQPAGDADLPEADTRKNPDRAGIVTSGIGIDGCPWLVPATHLNRAPRPRRRRDPGWRSMMAWLTPVAHAIRLCSRGAFLARRALAPRHGPPPALPHSPAGPRRRNDPVRHRRSAAVRRARHHRPSARAHAGASTRWRRAASTIGARTCRTSSACRRARRC